MSAPEARRVPPASLLAIGNFDGVHLGHQALLRVVAERAKQAGLLPKVLTFSPHPSEVLGRGKLPVLTRVATKVALLESCVEGLGVEVERFDLQLAAMTPSDFAEEVLKRRHAAAHVVVGANFRFGKGRVGDLATLTELGQRLGFRAEALELVTDASGPISSSRIRELIAEGHVEQASVLLGRPHRLLGGIVEGDRVGRRLGFPTANLAEVEEVLPCHGVYACRAVLGGEGEERPAICNIGTRPTLGGTSARVEVHLLDYSGDLYGRELQVSLVRRLRGERRFESTDALRAQIAEDVEVAARLLRSPES